MFSVGGAVGAYVAPLFLVFDMVELAWINSYDPNAPPYSLSQNITSVIGGKYETPHLILILDSSL
jgi:hypothetical protein